MTDGVSSMWRRFYRLFPGFIDSKFKFSSIISCDFLKVSIACYHIIRHLWSDTETKLHYGFYSICSVPHAPTRHPII